MSAGRRGILGAAGALGLLSGSGNVRQGVRLPHPGAPSYGGAAQAAAVRPIDSLAYKAWEEARANLDRSQRRAQIKLQLLGGLPPRFVGMNSNAAWFTAQRAAVAIEAAEHERSSTWNKLRASILGDE